MNRVILRSSGKEVICQEEHSSILLALEAQKISIEYQCREGYCGSCRCRLLSGKVDWLIDPIALVREGEILLCCCQAKGNIEIETIIIS